METKTPIDPLVGTNGASMTTGTDGRVPITSTNGASMTAAPPSKGTPTKTAAPTKTTAPTKAAPPATAPAAPTLDATQRDAFAYLTDLLNQYGLGSLSTFVMNEIIAGKSQTEVALDLQQTPEFKAAFPEIAARQAAGLPAISAGDIISYRNGAAQLMRAAGLPPGFYDNATDFANLIGSDVSLSELNDRVNMAKDATYNIDPATAARLSQEFGLTPGSGGLAAYYLDPTKALPLLQRQMQAAMIGGAADEVGYTGFSNDTADQLAQAGVTPDQARAGFNTLQNETQLFNTLPGEPGEAIDQQQQISATFLGNAAAQQNIERRRQSREAAFSDGGAYAATAKGVTGLGGADAL